MRGLGMRKCKMILSIMILSILALSISCVTNPDIRQLSPETRARAGKIMVYKGFSIPEDKYQVIGYIEGISCKGTYYSNKVVNEQEAINGLRIKAAQLGADAVINVVCQYKGWGFSNCVQSILCVGDAIRIKKE